MNEPLSGWPPPKPDRSASSPPTTDGPRDLVRALAEFSEITRVYRVLPHERWAAERLLDNVYSANPRPSKLTRKDGVIGCVGTGILYAGGLPSMVLGMTGLLMLFVSDGAYWAYALIYSGIAGIFATLLRAIPTFRASQRYLKAGDWRPPSLAPQSGLAFPSPAPEQDNSVKGNSVFPPHSHRPPLPPPPPPGVDGPPPR